MSKNRRIDFLLNSAYLALSTELVASHNNTRLTVFTDDYGSEFYKKIGIKADVLSCLDNEISEDHKYNWAFPKIVSIEKLDAPFYHIDGDVFLYQKQTVHGSPITAQTPEISSIQREMYYAAICGINEADAGILPESTAPYQTPLTAGGYNCGYLHVQDNTIKKLWTAMSMEIFNKQKFKISVDAKPWFSGHASSAQNIIAEQFSLYCIHKIHSEAWGRPIVTPLMSNFTPNTGNKSYEHLMGMKSRIRYMPLKNDIFLKVIKQLDAFNPVASNMIFDELRELLSKGQPIVELFKEAKQNKLTNFPSAGTMAKNFTNALLAEGKSMVSGQAQLSEEEINKRMDTCKQCEFFYSPSKRCKKCGCFLAFKTSWRSQHCPIGKW